MTIQCPDQLAFLDIIHGLVMRGLTFTSDAGKLSIELQGGY